MENVEQNKYEQLIKNIRDNLFGILVHEKGAALLADQTSIGLSEDEKNHLKELCTKQKNSADEAINMLDNVTTKIKELETVGKEIVGFIDKSHIASVENTSAIGNSLKTDDVVAQIPSNEKSLAEEVKNNTVAVPLTNTDNNGVNVPAEANAAENKEVDIQIPVVDTANTEVVLPKDSASVDGGSVELSKIGDTTATNTSIETASQGNMPSSVVDESKDVSQSVLNLESTTDKSTENAVVPSNNSTADNKTAISTGEDPKAIVVNKNQFDNLVASKETQEASVNNDTNQDKFVPSEVTPASPANVAPQVEATPVASAAPANVAPQVEATPVAPVAPVNEAPQVEATPVAPAAPVGETPQVEATPVAPAAPVGETPQAEATPVAPASPVDVAPQVEATPVAPASPVDVAPQVEAAPVAPVANPAPESEISAQDLLNNDIQGKQKQMEAMLQQASEFYNSGKIAEAQELYSKVSIMNQEMSAPAAGPELVKK